MGRGEDVEAQLQQHQQPQQQQQHQHGHHPHHHHHQHQQQQQHSSSSSSSRHSQPRLSQQQLYRGSQQSVPGHPGSGSGQQGVSPEQEVEYEEQSTWPRPYLSPGLSRAYRKAWQMEIAIGLCIAIVGLVCLLVDDSEDWTLGAGAIGIGMMVVGSISIILGICWQQNLSSKKKIKVMKKRRRKHKAEDKQPIMSPSPSQEFDNNSLHGSQTLSLATEHTILTNKMI